MDQNLPNLYPGHKRYSIRTHPRLQWTDTSEFWPWKEFFKWWISWTSCKTYSTKFSEDFYWRSRFVIQNLHVCGLLTDLRIVPTGCCQVQGFSISTTECGIRRLILNVRLTARIKGIIHRRWEMCVHCRKKIADCSRTFISFKQGHDKIKPSRLIVIVTVQITMSGNKFKVGATNPPVGIEFTCFRDNMRNWSAFASVFGKSLGTILTHFPPSSNIPKQVVSATQLEIKIIRIILLQNY